ncbi:uncharacterized protein [Euwallacea similis]|uniref:uncharacterized protein n=1 Tax=Euwallacea similis TaxID=1736056 RepID=UPI00344C262F
MREKRKASNELRRKWTRLKAKKPSEEEIKRVHREYKDAKKNLTNEIRESKRKKWRQLCEDLENDVWGKAYQILTKRLGLGRRQDPSEEETRKQVDKLFPRRPKIEWRKEKEEEEIRQFDTKEIEYALTRMKLKKAPGPDNIPTEVMVKREKSAVDALRRVKKITEDIKMKAVKNWDFCAMVLLDVENPFNSVPWENIIKTIEKKGISRYLVRIVKAYLTNRKIIIIQGEFREMNCRVPQGSVLGPILWNFFYDEVLKIRQVEGVSLIAYADDLAVIVRAGDQRSLEEKTKFAVKEVVDKIEFMGLSVARRKTEMVVIAGRRKIREMSVRLGKFDFSSSR